MVLAWVFSCGELVKTARWRPFVIGSFSASCVMGWTVLGSVCRAGLMASAGRCACLYRLALPLPLGAGDYVRPAGVGSACGEGVGDIVEVLLSRGSPSFYFAALVVIVSPCLLRRLPVSFSSSPPASCASFLPPASVPVLRSRVVSYRSSPRSCDEPGGAIFACLPHPFSVLALSSRAPPPALPLSSRVPVLACPSWIVLDRSLRSPVLVSCRRLPVPIRLRSGLIAPCSSCLPVLRQAWAGSVSDRSCLPIALVWGILIARAAGGVGWIASAGTGLLLGVSASGGGCVRFVVSLFVYIN